MDSRRPHFEPTQAEIKRGCEEIQKAWDEREEKLRRRARTDDHGNTVFEVPICKVGME